MRIIAGEARGRRFQSPQGNDTRPTRDRIKEALFGSIQMHFPCDAVLDLFAGSGALGLECLSRGAGHAVFVDNARACEKLIRSNLESLGFASRAEVWCMDTQSALMRLERVFDVITLDPPYQSALGVRAVETIFAKKLLAKDGIAVLEHAPGETIAPDDAYRIVYQRKYGASMLTAFVYPTP